MFDKKTKKYNVVCPFGIKLSPAHSFECHKKTPTYLSKIFSYVA